MKRRLAHLMLAVLGSSMVLLLPASASAAPYDGTDPAETICASSAFTPAGESYNTANFQGHTSTYVVELRYSTGCGTAWARVTCTDGNGCGYVQIWVERRSDSPAGYAKYSASAYLGYGDSTYTVQLYDGGTANHARACDLGYVACTTWF